MLIELIRLENREDQGVLGVLRIEGEILCYTLERPWLDNARDKSCIPVGVYACKRKSSAKYGETIELCDVPGRTDILIHVGNTIDDSKGCILLGLQVGWLGATRAVLSSRAAILQFRARIASAEDIAIQVRWSDQSV